MVSHFFLIRRLVPPIGILALTALFFKLPETPNFFNIFGCKSCISADPYLPLVGAGYFALLCAVSLLFPSFPNRQIAKGGLIWAFSLAIVLTYLYFPALCLACLICHVCNILIWLIWLMSKPTEYKAWASLNERLCLALFTPISVVALFSCLNLTFMIYGFKLNSSNLSMPLKQGDVIVDFDTHFSSVADTYLINFISPDCLYCKEQLPILHQAAEEASENAFHFISVSPELSPELVEKFPKIRWLEDSDGGLRKLFKVMGYPTLYVVDKKGKILEVIPGVPHQLEEKITTFIPAL